MTPVVLVYSGLAAAAAYFGYQEFRKPAAKRPLDVPPILNQPGSPRLDVQPPPPNAPTPAPVHVATTTGGNPIIAITPINPDTGKPTISGQLATEGIATGPAHVLYDFLKANGVKASAALTAVTTAFQTAHNSSENAKKVTGGTIPVTGNYDTPTSGALTVYTGVPIPPDPSTPAPEQPSTAPGPAANTGSNLYAYLKVNKNDKSPTLKALVLAFQKAVNTDPKFPGPAFPIASVRIIKQKLTEDGVYGAKTSDALAIGAYERINP
jgi:hypothetical protein